jgi:hypothetical protein
MSQIGSIDAASAQAAQASAANAESGNTSAAQTARDKLGLPPAALAAAASANTVNAALAVSQWGLDPASVGGVYGSTDFGAILSGANLLPLLRSLSPATAEQALALIGIDVPRAGGRAAATPTAADSQAASKALLDQASMGSAPVVVDPLWGRTA